MSSSLRTGTVLGSYRIVAPLGAGGMGEVYRAHDSKLDRPVAIKILPESVVRDADRVRRFIQEARSASSLSHPNIITIHDIGETIPVEEGSEANAPADATPVYFIAMELVEGATLRKLFEDHTLQPRELLAHLAQAAEGLAKAHSAGIVHRDLKPENIMVTRDGYAKVLDFGLAKLTETAASGSALGAALTELGDQVTREGAVVGTVGYMSPEQAMGKPVDHRTDLFAFGCLLYEAATGKKPFLGESSVDILHAIVREEPTPVEEIAPEIPRALVRTIRRCLAKDPERRYQSMKDLALELHEMVDEWDDLALPTGTVSSASALSSLGAAPRGGLGGLGRAGWIGIAVGAIALVVAGIVLWRGQPAPAPGAAAFQAMEISAATTTGNVVDAALSPDGRYVIAIRGEAGGGSLWLRQLATGSDVQLLPPQGVKPLRNPGFTPSGDYVVYTLSDEQRSLSTLYRMPVLGGPARRIVADIDTAVTYSPDGSRIAFVRQSVARQAHELLMANADGSGESKLASRLRADGHGFEVGRSGLGPAWSPDGRSIAISGFDTTGEFRGEIVRIDIAGGAERRIGETNWFGIGGLAWTHDGAALVVSGVPKGAAFTGQLWRLTVPGGALSRITNDAQNYQGASVSSDGRALVSVQHVASATLWRRSLAGPADERQLTFGSRDGVSGLAVSGDGTLHYSFGRGNIIGVARLDPEGGDPFTLSRPETPAEDVQVSRDGKAVLFRTLLGDGRIVVLATDQDGANAREVPVRDPLEQFVIHPDGTWLVTCDERGLWRQPLDGSEATLLVEQSSAFPIGFSPAGDRLLYIHQDPTDEGSLRTMITVIPAAGGAPLLEYERPRPANPTDKLRWAPDGEAFTVRAREGNGYNLWRVHPGGAGEKLTDFDSVQLWDYVISPDGKTLFYTKGVEWSDAVMIENFQ